jgi:hypothetical protein
MPTVNKGPGDPWPALVRGIVIALEPGEHQPHEFSGVPDVTIQGTPGAKIIGSVNIGGGEPPCSMRFHDGANGLRILGPLEVSHSEGRGIRITEAEEITLQDLDIHHCSVEGIITGNCPQSEYRRIRVARSRASSQDRVRLEYPPDRRHGIYLSGDASNSEVEKLTVLYVTGSALQLNGAGMDRIIRDLHAWEIACYHCGSGGTPPLSLMAVRDSVIRQFFQDWVAGDRWGVCFADGKPGYHCEGVEFREYTVPARAHLAIEQGSNNITTEPGAGWTPGEPPEPQPPNEMQALIDEAQAAVAAIETQQAVAAAALAVISQQAQVAEDALARIEALSGG